MSIAKLMNTERPFISDGGMETSMIFHEGFDLPHFASSVLLKSEDGRAAIERYYQRFIEMARLNGQGYLLDTVTWRTNAAWAPVMGLTPGHLARINTDAVVFARTLAIRLGQGGQTILVNGVVGPAGDGYLVGEALTAEAAEAIHIQQLRVFVEAGADLATGMTIPYIAEGVGIAQAAKKVGLPVVISFTLETDGKLPSGETLGAAIAEVDAATDSYPIYYMINCAHPDHFHQMLAEGGAWRSRIGGLRTNASRMSHAELDVCEELDDGDPEELGRLHRELLMHLPNVRVLGGCCGTDHRHVGCIAAQTHAHHVA